METYIKILYLSRSALQCRSPQQKHLGDKEAEAMAEAGEKSAKAVIAKVIDTIGKEPLARIDYAEIVSMDDLVPLDRIDGGALVVLAVYIGKTRLIDNIRISSRG